MSMLFRWPGLVASAAAASGPVTRSLTASLDALGTTASFTAYGVDTNAGTARIRRGADLTSNADVAPFFFSMWIKPATTGNGNIYSTGANQILLAIISSALRVQGEEPTGGTTVVSLNGGAVASSVWQHFCGSFDASTASAFWVRKNGITQSVTGTFTTPNVIDQTNSDHCWGANPAGGVAFNGAFGEVWVDHQFIANTDANVQKFISNVSGTGSPVDLGATGTAPGFGQPIMYFSRRSSDSSTITSFQTNLGTGGGFTWTNTPLDGVTISL